ncbi:lytic transglycosylase domain-containing protein [Phenylobacterium sp.]|uniref:lytic transglycosylase domain-containing protein n=1 Tax=Phenylobacterium sp. TaxID=1871053 RepID=UPI002FCC143C
MRLRLPLHVISLFGRRRGHFPVPANFDAAVARSGGPGRRLAPARQRLALDGRELGGSLASGGTSARRLRSVCVAATVLLVWPVAAQAQGVPAPSPQGAAARLDLGTRIEAAVEEAARRFDLPEALIWSVMRAESARNPRAVSRAGAMGLMQLMPRTWAELRARLELGDDPFDVRDNVIAGAAYLRELRDRFGVPGFLAAYNAGPGRYAEHLSTGRPLPQETRAYVTAVVSDLGLGSGSGRGAVAALRTPDWRRAPLFAGARVLTDDGPVTAEKIAPVPSTQSETGHLADPLFAVRLDGGVRP